MENTILPGRLGKFETPGRVTFAHGSVGLPKINITTSRSTAEIYLHGAHVTGFQKRGEPPLLFLSRLSQFATGKAIRGGVPVCFPWFGPREGDVAHGFARITEWDLIETAATPDGGVMVCFRLPSTAANVTWPAIRAEFIVTVTDQLAMELIATNELADRNFDFENCLHTYFAVGDVNRVSITGLQGAPFDDFAAGAGGEVIKRRAFQAGDGNSGCRRRRNRCAGNSRSRKFRSADSLVAMSSIASWSVTVTINSARFAGQCHWRAWTAVGSGPSPRHRAWRRFQSIPIP